MSCSAALCLQCLLRCEAPVTLPLWARFSRPPLTEVSLGCDKGKDTHLIFMATT